MKSTNRIRKNSATKPARPQVQTKHPLEIGHVNSYGGYTGYTPVCLTMFDHRSDKNISGMDISKAQLQALRREAKRLGLSLSGLLRKSIERVILNFQKSQNTRAHEVDA